MFIECVGKKKKFVTHSINYESVWIEYWRKVFMKKNYPKSVVGTLKDQRAPIRIFPKPLLCSSYHADKLSNITPLGEIACTDYVSLFMYMYI